MPDRIRHYHRTEIRLPFRDIDSWGLVWHGHYFSYVDFARLDLLKRFESPFGEFARLGFVMPVVRVEMDLRAPGRADDLVFVDAAMIRSRGAMIDTHFKIQRVADVASGDGKLLAQGFTRQVFTRVDGGLLYHVPKSVEPGFDRLNDFAFHG